jgi:anti-sigma B factor antagonist
LANEVFLIRTPPTKAAHRTADNQAERRTDHGWKEQWMLAQSIEIDQQGQLVVVKMPLHEISSAQMQCAIDACLERLRYDNGQNFLFDLENVHFLDSSCLGVLVSFLQEVEHVRGRIGIVHCSENVAFLFKVTRLDAVFTLFDDIAEAVAAF